MGKAPIQHFWNGQWGWARLDIYLERDATGKTARYWDPGFLATLPLSGLLALVVDGRPATAFFVGVSVAHFGQSVIAALIERQASALGWHVRPDDGGERADRDREA